MQEHPLVPGGKSEKRTDLGRGEAVHVTEPDHQALPLWQAVTSIISSLAITAAALNSF